MVSGLKLKTLKRDEATVLYVDNYYDYARSGVCKWNDKRYYFEETTTDFVYELYNLSPADWEKEDVREASFVEHVGEHCRYVDGKINHGAPLKPYSQWSKYYDDSANDHVDYTRKYKPVAFWDRNTDGE